MSLSHWLGKQLKKTEVWRELNERLSELEKEMKNLNSSKTEGHEAATHIEFINIEKIVVDRYEQSNNFGALGIKSLEGRLNIGANYGVGEPIPEEKQKKFEDKLKKTAIHYSKKTEFKVKHTKTPPKTTIRPRPGDVS